MNTIDTAELHAEFYGDIPRRVAKYSDFGHVEGYISETVHDTTSGA